MDNRIKALSKMENKDGDAIDTLMVMFIKANGKMILKKEKVPCGILIKINIKDNGLKARKMDGVNIFIIMAPFIKAILQMEENMVLEQFRLVMVLKFKLIGIKLMFKERVKYFIPMVTFSMVSIICLKSMGKDFTFGVQIIQSIKESLRKTLYKEKLKYILLQMSIILAESEMVKEMDKEHMHIKMEIYLVDNGKMISN